MFPLVAQLRFDDAPDLACVGNAAAETNAYWCALAVVPTILLAVWYRPKAAQEDQHNTWAAIAFLAGVLQTIVMLFQIAPGCLSGHAVSIFVGCASPWFVVAALFRSAVAPLPPALRSNAATPEDRGGLL
jgi:hypothetical protein